MAHTRWVIGVGLALLLLPMAAAFLFPPRVIAPIPEPRPASPPIVYRIPPAQPNDLSGVAIRVRSGLVNLRVNTGYDTPGNALHRFIAALETYPHARRVRASWSMLLAMNEMDTTVLYDRCNHSVILFSQGDGDLGAYRDHVLFTSVQETVFVKIADERRDDYSEQPDGFFDDLGLPYYGCRKRDLGSWHKAPRD